MFFIVSKIAGYFLQPIVLLVVAMALATVLLWTRFFKAARWLVTLLSIIFLVIAFTPVNFILMSSLEYRIERSSLPEKVDGIVVLGGSFDNYISTAKSTTELRASADRMVEAIALAKRFPNAKMLFTGGANTVTSTTRTEADIAAEMFSALGIDTKRVLYENRARNTYENALYAFPLAKPKAGENWLLITSAFHMPRSYGIFRRVGWKDIIPWPVDYRTQGDNDRKRISTSTRQHFANLDIAVREYIGLIAYWLTGKTDQLFPKRVKT